MFINYIKILFILLLKFKFHLKSNFFNSDNDYGHKIYKKND